MMLTMIWRRVAVILFVFLWFGHSAYGQEVTNRDRFQLFNNCDEIRIVIKRLGEDASKIDLTKSAVEITLRSRLRGARIYTRSNAASAYVYARVYVVGGAFNAEVEFVKPVFDSVSGINSHTRTWYATRTGTHSGDYTYILNHVGQITDEFVDEYLRVNAPAC